MSSLQKIRRRHGQKVERVTIPKVDAEGKETTESLFHWIPHNWPATLDYTSSLVWRKLPKELRTKYREYSTLSECTEVKYNEHGQLALFAKLQLPDTCLLEEYLGEIVEEAEMGERTDLHMFLYDTGEGKLYVDASNSGNETRFMRKVEEEDEQMNCKITPIYLDGEYRLFVELQRTIEAGEELVLGRYYGYHNEDIEWKGKLQELYPNVNNSPVPKEEAEKAVAERTPLHKKLMDYTYTTSLLYDRLPDEHVWLMARRCLADWIELKTVDDPSLPYHGQVGCYAACDIRSGTYIGEYCGEIFICDGTSESLYVAKFTNSYEEEETDLVRIDGVTIGNETRYINDSRNTGRDVNVQFILAWMSGSLHLFVVSIEDIKKGQEILIDYGEEYWDVLDEWHDWEGEEAEEEEEGEEEAKEEGKATTKEDEDETLSAAASPRSSVQNSNAESVSSAVPIKQGARVGGGDIDIKLHITRPKN